MSSYNDCTNNMALEFGPDILRAEDLLESRRNQLKFFEVFISDENHIPIIFKLL